MKTTAIVTIKRLNKDIVIYLNDGYWNSLPDLSFIADVEVYEQPECSKKEVSYYSEFGCSSPVVFNTSEGRKTMQPGKSYDENLNEI